MFKSMYMQDANCIWVETDLITLLCFAGGGGGGAGGGGRIAIITFKTKICKLALQLSPPPLLLASQELVLQRQS